MTRRCALRRARAAGGLAWDALHAAGWPGTSAEAEGARHRTHTAVWTLRRLGLEGHLVTSGEGDRLVNVRVG